MITQFNELGSIDIFSSTSFLHYHLKQNVLNYKHPRTKNINLFLKRFSKAHNNLKINEIETFWEGARIKLDKKARQIYFEELKKRDIFCFLE
jgi:hypothetical protein